MSVQTNTAKKCFAENIQLFAHAQTEPEKFNLYNGLHNATDAIEQLERRLLAIEQNIEHILHRLNR